MRNFKDLKVWQRSHQLTLEIYVATKTFPREEQFGLTAQLRRAAASVSANLAEGCERQTDREMSRFVQIAMGSASELEYHLLLATDLVLLSRDRVSTSAGSTDRDSEDAVELFDDAYKSEGGSCEQKLKAKS